MSMANKTKIVHVAIEPDGYKKLQAVAAKERRTLSDTIRLAIYHFLLERKAL